MELNEMAGKVNSIKLINELQRSMALKDSGAQGPYHSGKRHDGCDEHGCKPTCGYHGYCDFEATRYYYSGEGKAESRDRKGERHDYYKRRMRLGYDRNDY